MVGRIYMRTDGRFPEDLESILNSFTGKLRNRVFDPNHRGVDKSVTPFDRLELSKALDLSLWDRDGYDTESIIEPTLLLREPELLGSLPAVDPVSLFGIPPTGKMVLGLELMSTHSSVTDLPRSTEIGGQPPRTSDH